MNRVGKLRKEMIALMSNDDLKLLKEKIIGLLEEWVNQRRIKLNDYRPPLEIICPVCHCKYIPPGWCPKGCDLND